MSETASFDDKNVEAILVTYTADNYNLMLNRIIFKHFFITSQNS